MMVDMDKTNSAAARIAAMTTEEREARMAELTAKIRATSPARPAPDMWLSEQAHAWARRSNGGR